MNFLLSNIAGVALLLQFFATAQAAADDTLRLESDTAVASAGYFQLLWETEGTVNLRESATADFNESRLLYTGTDRARLMSGKPDGDYYYRVESDTAPDIRSEVLKVEVRHHPVARALQFFAVGAVVFLATLGLIVFGSLRDKQ